MCALEKYCCNVTMCIRMYSMYNYVIVIYGKSLIVCINFVSFLYAVPDYPILNGTSCYSLTQDRSEGKVNATIRLALHSGWKSLATVASMQGRLSLREPFTRILSIPGLPPEIVRENITLKSIIETQAIEASSNCIYNALYPRLFSKVFVGVMQGFIQYDRLHPACTCTFILGPTYIRMCTGHTAAHGQEIDRCTCNPAEICHYYTTICVQKFAGHKLCNF